MAFYMAKYPDKMIDVVKPFTWVKTHMNRTLRTCSMEPSTLDIEVCTAVLSFMWNMKITIIYPSKGSVPFYHRDCTPDVVLVFNENGPTRKSFHRNKT